MTTVPYLQQRGTQWYVRLVDGSELGPYWTREQAEDAADDLMGPGEPDELDVQELLRLNGRQREWQRKN